MHFYTPKLDNTYPIHILFSEEYMRMLAYSVIANVAYTDISKMQPMHHSRNDILCNTVTVYW